MYETGFRDRGIDRLCMKRVSWIGVLIEVSFVLFSFVPLLSLLFFGRGDGCSFIK